MSEAERLHKDGRFGEALLIIDAGLADPDAERSEQLGMLRERVIADRDSVFRRVREFGIGAMIGEGTSIESIMGAITADMFVVGDVRDVIIQGSRLAVDGETDELILCLSTVGILTTVLPGVDWAPALLKLARKVGAIGHKMADAIIVIIKRAVDGGDIRGLQSLLADTATLSRRITPGGFLRVVRHVDDPASLAKLARFVDRNTDGAFALYRSGPDGVRTVAKGDDAAADALLIVAKKDDSGLAWLRHGKVRLLRPHPLLGLAKSLGKGNLGQLIQQLQQLLDRYVWAILAILFLWTVAECLLIRHRLRRRNAPRPLAP